MQMSIREKTTRLARVTAKCFLVDSLVGSFFVGDGRSGCVVAEVSPGVSLVEMDEAQELRPLSAMMDWRFYDTIDAATAAMEN